MPRPSRIALLVAIALVAYLLFPVKSLIEVRNTLGEPQQAKVTVLGLGFIPLYSKQVPLATLYLPKGPYGLRIERYGFEPRKEWLWLRPNLIPEAQTYAYTLKEKTLPLSQWRFDDPTGTLTLDPSFSVTGRDVRGVPVDAVLHREDTLTYGWYDVTVRDPHFEGSFWLDGHVLEREGSLVNVTRLSPNERFFTITDEDAAFIAHFMRDYLDLSAKGAIEERMRGYPRQYYVASRERHISLGDMAFLLCEMRAFAAPQPEYFLPLDKQYALSTDALDGRGCYADALAGYVPRTVGGVPLAALLEGEAGREEGGNAAGAAQVPFEVGELNARTHRGEISFTFDIESGRYVFAANKGPDALSPCASELLARGLEPGALARCEDADAVAWFSAVDGEPEPDGEGAIPYPWSSGVRGTRAILDLSARTGIRTTQFMVTRDLAVMGEYDPALIEDLRRMAQDGLVEVALHSNHHSHLGAADPEETLEELTRGRLLLERSLNTTVVGYRAPYLSVLGGNQTLHEQVLSRGNFSYYSHDLGVRGETLLHKPYTLHYLADRTVAEMEGSQDAYGYVMTLDHPWNFHYVEQDRDGSWWLSYNASRADAARARVYEAVASGFAPVTAAQLSAGEPHPMPLQP